MQRLSLRCARWVVVVMVVGAGSVLPMRAQMAGVALASAGTPAAQVPAPPGHRLMISGGVMAKLLVKTVKPVYPEEAKRAHVRGTVVLRVLINKEGKVESAEAMSGSELLKQAAVDAVTQWVYKPYLLNGQPVDVSTTVLVAVP